VSLVDDEPQFEPVEPVEPVDEDDGGNSTTDIDVERED